MNVRNNLETMGSRLAKIRGVLQQWEGTQLLGITVVFLVIFIVSALVSDQFLTTYNVTIMIRTLAFIGIVSIAQGMLLLLGDIDASIGAIAGLSAVISAIFMVRLGFDPHLSMLIGLGAGALMGGLNGFLITTFRLSALVLTIGMLTTYKGLNLAVTRGRTITGIPREIRFYGQGMFLGIPVPALFLAGVFIVAWFVTKRTVFGRNMYALGNSREAARMVGIPTKRVRITTYAISGAMAGLAGILMSMRIASAQPSIGDIWLLPSIAGPVIGGIAITGGEGSITGALIGGAIMGVISNIVVLGGVSLYWQEVINGLIVVAAVIFDSLTRSNRT